MLGKHEDRANWVSDRALFGGLTALVAIAIIAAGFVSMYPGALHGVSPSSSTSGATSSTGSILGGSQTVLATLAASTTTSAPGTSTTSSSAQTSTTSSTSTSIASSVSTTSSSSGGGSYTVTPSSQVQVISVAAIVPQGGSGSVTFSVQFKNIGDGDIYVLNGGGSGLNVTVTSGSSLLRQVATPKCEIAVAMTPVSPGSSWTSVVPGCWSGYSYELVGSGTIGVELQLSWSSGASSATGESSVTIYATFPV